MTESTAGGWSVHYDPANPVTLYNFAMSPFGLKVVAFLLFKKLSFHHYHVSPLTFKKELPTGYQVPVVTIGKTSRADSEVIGLWLDEAFPEQPLLLPEDPSTRERLLAINDWVTRRVIPITFRIPQEPGWNTSRITNGWKLSHIMNQTCNGGLPKLLELAWPLVLATQPFLKQVMAMSEPDKPIGEVKQRMYEEFLQHLEGGPFFAGRETPSLPDVATYPQIVVPYLVGMQDADYFFEYPELVAWLKAMAPYVQGNPPLIAPHVCVNALPW